MLTGIDYYAGDGTPDLAGLDFAFYKATEGMGAVDPHHTREIARIRSAGLVVGHYHFGWPNEDAIRQADHFLNVADPQPGDLLWLDFEPYPDRRNWGTQGNGQRDQWRHAFIDRVRAQVGTRHRIGTYCDTGVWHSIPTDDPGDALWIADWGVSAPGIAHHWDVWQYRGSPLDLDRANFTSREAMQAWAHRETTPPPPVHTPAPPPPVHTPTPTPEDDDMPSFTMYHEGGASFPAGKFTSLHLFADNTYAGGDKGPGAKVRAVVWATGEAPHVVHVEVTDHSAAPTIVPFPHPDRTHTVTCTREDDTAFPVYGCTA